jgi:hypothetical protein
MDPLAVVRSPSTVCSSPGAEMATSSIPSPLMSPTEIALPSRASGDDPSMVYPFRSLAEVPYV